MDKKDDKHLLAHFATGGASKEEDRQLWCKSLDPETSWVNSISISSVYLGVFSQRRPQYFPPHVLF